VQLLDLYLPDYRGLGEFRLDFSNARDICVLVGRNGRGKSRMLHALVEIFGTLSRNTRASFGYRVRYTRSGHLVEIVQENSNSTPVMKLSIEGPAEAIIRRSDWQLYLPDHVFGYQSVKDSAWDIEFEIHAAEDRAASRGIGKRFNKASADSELGLRPLFHCGTHQLPLILLSLLPNWSDHFARHAEEVGVLGFASADLVIHRPAWAKGSRYVNLPYWGLQGYSRVLFDRISSMGRFGAIPTRDDPSNFSEFRISISTYADLEVFLGLFESDATMFATLERLASAGLLTADVRLTMRGGFQITPGDLSSGEQQMLTVMGLLRLQRGEESLFLLDEPASHFHPGWSQRWFSSVSEMLEDGQKSQFVAATHDPALVSNIPQQQLRILRSPVPGTIVAEVPSIDPRGYGIGNLLTSELYGLTSQLDDVTRDLIDEQYELVGRGQLGEEDLIKLGEVNATLDSLGFATTRRDPVVSLFLAELDKRRKELIERASGGNPPSQGELASLVARLFDERLTRGL
jgi:predicted ATPase